MTQTQNQIVDIKRIVDRLRPLVNSSCNRMNGESGTSCIKGTPMIPLHRGTVAAILQHFEAHLRSTSPAGEVGEMIADSGMSGEAVERAEWAWANLPVGPRKWTSLPTHEKALVCHVVERLAASDTEAMRLLREARDLLLAAHEERVRIEYSPGWHSDTADLLARIDALAKGGAT